MPDSGSYQAVLGALDGDRELRLTATEVASATGGDPDGARARLERLVAWGNVTRTDEADSLVAYRAGTVRYGLTDLGRRILRAVSATSVEVAAATAPDPPSRWLAELAGRVDAAGDEEAARLYAAAIGVPSPEPTAAEGPPPPALDLAAAREAVLERDGRAGRELARASGELREAAADLARRRLSRGAFRLLTDLLGRALAQAAPDGDAYVADAPTGLELQLLRAPGVRTPLYGEDGVITLDGFKVRVAPLDGRS
ncbi:DUF2397 family protein [Actinorhabdospora filicis]|uniref:DUF2397 family protein n=1 Tax=Actinorhabdospora filicis TaxID=1785913 RepID=UPI002553BC55|nr:DUF2397 family protein [Actinorhabdospora filicis]